MSYDVLEGLEKKTAHLGTVLRVEKIEEQIFALKEKMNDPTFWDDRESAQDAVKELHALEAEYEKWDGLQKDIHEMQELYTIAQEENDSETIDQLNEMVSVLEKRYDDLELYVLLSGEYDQNDALISFYAGAGGVDAQDWTQMLYRMITRYCEKKNFSVTVLEYTAGQEAGIKSAVIQVSGRYAYGFLHSENGTHRLVRVSPFDAEGMRHTSFANIEVLPDVGEIPEIEVPEKDLRIDVFRSGGNGGQSVNTTDSAVRIVHIPTGITAVCQSGKSQHQNKEAAMKILYSRLYQKYEAEKKKERDAIRGEYTSAEWGNQIRSYVLHPYKMVKDHRTKQESKDPDAVLAGDLDAYIEAYLRYQQK